jgi:hypothetical protein
MLPPTKPHLGVTDGPPVFDHTGGLVLYRAGIMLLQLPPKGTICWYRDVCTHTAWMLGTGDGGGGHQVRSKRLKLCVPLVVVQCMTYVSEALIARFAANQAWPHSKVRRAFGLVHVCSGSWVAIFRAAPRRGMCGGWEARCAGVPRAYGHIQTRYSRCVFSRSCTFTGTSLLSSTV